MPEVTEEKVERRIEQRTEGIDADARIEKGSLTITADVIPEFETRYEKEEFAVTGSVEKANDLVDEIVEKIKDFRIDMNNLQKFNNLIKRPPDSYDEFERKQEDSPTEILEEIKDWYERLAEVAPTQHQRRELAKGVEEMKNTIESRQKPKRKPSRKKKVEPLKINLSELSNSLNSELMEKDYVDMRVDNIILDTVRGKFSGMPTRPSFRREEGNLYAVWAKPFREGKTLRISVDSLSSMLAGELRAFSPLTEDKLEGIIEPWLTDTLKTVGSPKEKDGTIVWSPGETGKTIVPSKLPERTAKEEKRKEKPATEKEKRPTVADLENEIEKRMEEL